MRYLDFIAGFVGMGIPNLKTTRYNLKWSTKGIKGQQGFNWAKHAARSNYARGIP